MEIEKFTQKYPKVDRKMIARICHCSIGTVNRWFMSKSKGYPPTDDQKLRLDLFDFLYQRKVTEPETFKELQEIIEEITD